MRQLGLVAAFWRRTERGIGRALQFDRPVRRAIRSRRRAAPLAQREQKVLHRARFELVGQSDAVGKQLVAVLVHEAHAPVGEDFAAIAVPGDAIRAHRAVAAAQHHIAVGGDGVAGGIVAERIGFEGDLVTVDALARGQIDPVLRGIFERALAQIGSLRFGILRGLVLEPIGIGPVGLFLRGRHTRGRAILREAGAAWKPAIRQMLSALDKESPPGCSQIGRGYAGRVWFGLSHRRSLTAIAFTSGRAALPQIASRPRHTYYAGALHADRIQPIAP